MVVFPHEVMKRDQQIETVFRADEDPTMQWCPHKKCSQHVSVGPIQGSQPKKAVCSVGHEFCALCNQGWHEGKACEEARTKCCITDKYKARQCPHCKNVVQIWRQDSKQSVFCSHCKHHFCWLCGDQFGPNSSNSEIEEHYSFLSPCKVGVMPGWLLVIMYLFLPVLMPIIPMIYACKFCDKHFICCTTHNRYGSRTCIDDIIDTICAIFMMLVLLVSLVFFIFFPVGYCLLIKYHIDLCNKREQGDNIFKSK